MLFTNKAMTTEDTKDSLSLTDEEDNDFDDEHHLPELAGTLNKWTNYIHGWQDRYIALKEGTLSYYKSEDDTAFGCRGAVSLAKAVITLHEFDDCRFDVSVNDCLWYLRARDAEERQMWCDLLEMHRQAESGYGSENSLRRHGSMLSLTSAASLSTTSTSSFKRGRGLKEKLAEMETFRDILCHQVDTLQNYFDACSAALANTTVHDQVADDSDDLEEDGHEAPRSGGSHNHFSMTSHSDKEDMINILQQHGAHAIDFKGESFTFKATTAGILLTLSHCIELMGQREDAWRRRLEKEIDKRKKFEDAYRTLLAERPKPIIVGGPDYEEGPHSVMNEEEFFDAIDATLDKIDKEDEKRSLFMKEKPVAPPPATSLDPSHPLYDEITSAVEDHLSHSELHLGDTDSPWILIAEEGEMKVYKRELVENDIILDPIKAEHTVKGITGHELCHYFWDPSVRMEWEGTLESTELVEWVCKDTIISHQVLKRVWPATQRDSLFWSTICHRPSEDDEAPDCWIVANHSTQHPDVPSSSKYVRITFKVAMICHTLVEPPDSGKAIQRSNLTCRIQYSAIVNPGGWAPASVIRMISKREIPKFLKTFTAFVLEKTKDQPIMY